MQDKREVLNIWELRKVKEERERVCCCTDLSRGGMAVVSSMHNCHFHYFYFIISILVFKLDYSCA